MGSWLYAASELSPALFGEQAAQEVEEAYDHHLKALIARIALLASRLPLETAGAVDALV
jgi:hypothetical protein